jgi:hypothetical protein
MTEAARSDPAPVAAKDQVVLILPARPELLAVARLAAAAVAAQAGFSLEQIEDLRLAVDELCSRFLPPAEQATTGSPAPLRLELRFAPGALEAWCSVERPEVPPGPGRPGQSERWVSETRALSDRILDALVSEHGGTGDHRGGSAWLVLRNHPFPSP